VKPTVYLETSIVSYLAALPSRDLLTAAHQQITHLWWRTRRSSFELFVSQLVIDECMGGDAGAAGRRLALLAEFSLLDIGPEVTDLARYLATAIPLAPRAATDAFHIAIAARHGIDYLLTWNCAHIANAELRPRISHACIARGYEPPILCTPEELIGGSSDGA
jgi:predicted nucleic acid-binding protein